MIESFSFAKVGRVTVSIGVVQITKNDFLSVLLSQADQALYYAKEHGRNQVSSYHTLVKRGELELLDTGEDIELF